MILVQGRPVEVEPLGAGRSWAIYVPTGPSKSKQYGHGMGRVFLTDEAKEWRNLVGCELQGEACLEGDIEVVLYHLSDRTGDDDIDHQLVPILDAITKARGWRDDKLVARVTIARDYVEPEDLAAGVYLFAWEIEGELP